MHVIANRAATILLSSLFLSVEAAAQEITSPDPYSGDLWTRSTLSGDWSGARNTLAAKNIIIDMSLTQAAQGLCAAAKTRAGSMAGGRPHFQSGYAENRPLVRRSSERRSRR